MALAGGCGGPPPAGAPSPEELAFAALGDAPYSRVEEVRFARVIDQLNARELAWVVHVGDLLWYPCSERMYRHRLAMLETIRHPVVYTPGDNEWADCWEPIAGGWPPLGRLAVLRGLFYPEPGRSTTGGLAVTSQAAVDAAYPEAVENVRWRRHGVVFATLHAVGSANAGQEFPGRGPENDAEVARRTGAAVAWIAAALALALDEGAPAVVLAMHADPVFELGRDDPYRRAFEPILDALARGAAAYGGPVLLIHGDSHEYTVDRPLRDGEGRPVANLVRLQVPGSPDVGWARVGIALDREPIFSFEEHLVRGSFLDYFGGVP